MTENILEVRGIVKLFPGVRALDGVDLSVRKGEVHAVVGENGAGKSTLMLVLGGIYRPDAGDIYMAGKKVSFDSAHDANQQGISVVYQELSLVQNLSIAENIFANRQPANRLTIINWKELHQKTSEMLAMFHMEYIRPDTLVKELSIANQQVVEILKAMSLHPKVLIFDEPTSSLTDLECKQLFENIKILKAQGISCIYISHHLSEIFEIADTVTVLRDGQYVCDANVAEIDEDFLITKMVGRKIENIYGRRHPDEKIGDEVFRAEGLSRAGQFEDIKKKKKKGEIVGFAGLVGAGRTEVGRAIFGVDPLDEGTLLFEGEKLNIRNAHDAIRQNIAYMTEDRKTQGLYLKFSLARNLISNRLGDFSRYGFLRESQISANAEKLIEEFHIITPGADQIVDNLSGGNQQKVLLSIWFGIKPKLLIVDEPTRGVDVGAKSEIYMLLRKLAASGVAIMMISSDLSEVLGVSDRIIVMKDGRIAGEIAAEKATEDNVIAMASSAGIQNQQEVCL